MDGHSPRSEPGARATCTGTGSSSTGPTGVLLLSSKGYKVATRSETGPNQHPIPVFRTYATPEAFEPITLPLRHVTCQPWSTASPALLVSPTPSFRALHILLLVPSPGPPSLKAQINLRSFYSQHSPAPHPPRTPGGLGWLGRAKSPERCAEGSSERKAAAFAGAAAGPTCQKAPTAPQTCALPWPLLPLLHTRWPVLLHHCGKPTTAHPNPKRSQ